MNTRLPFTRLALAMAVFGLAGSGELFAQTSGIRVNMHVQTASNFIKKDIPTVSNVALPVNGQVVAGQAIFQNITLNFNGNQWVGVIVNQALLADELVTLGDWRATAKGNSLEAFTSSGSSATFGLYCADNQCVFYLHNGLSCQAGSRSITLMSSVNSAASLSTECANIGANKFQILHPFADVLRTIKQGGIVNFAAPLQTGQIGISSFSLLGSNEAINRVLTLAATRNPSPQPQPPADKTLPGSKRPQDIIL